jgi:hypothetical protein
VKRTEAVRELAKQAGVTMRESYWTLGAHAVFEAPDDETLTEFSLSVARLGNVKTQTLRASQARTWTPSSARWCDGARWCEGQDGVIYVSAPAAMAGATSTSLVL